MATAKTTTMTPNQLAAKLAGAENADRIAKTVIRPFLRRTFPRAAELRGSAWILDAKQIKAVEDHWKARTSA